MDKKVKNITSLDLYLDFAASDIIEVESIEDVGCGIYPCYYQIKNHKLFVSTSAVSLVKVNNNGLILNENFNPPDFYNNPSIVRKRRLTNIFSNREKKNAVTKKILGGLHYSLRMISDSIKFDLVNYLFGEYVVVNQNWYLSYGTIDKRIFKLKPFELKTVNKSSNLFQSKRTLVDKDEIIKKASSLMTEFIQRVEKQFPNHKHIVLTAGKDSQLIWLAPKINAQNWSCFTAQPNVEIVKRWLHSNNIEPEYFFEDTNENIETIEDVKKKIIGSDLYSNIKHIRWLPRMIEIGEKFEGKCIFWGGTAADAIFSYYPQFHEDAEKFYDLHSKRVSSWQGNYHQTFKNFTGYPYLSPYHSEDIWKELFLKMDPLFIKQYKDLRYELGESLKGSQVNWIDENPSPRPYLYDFELKPKDYYIDYLKND